MAHNHFWVSLWLQLAFVFCVIMSFLWAITAENCSIHFLYLRSMFKKEVGWQWQTQHSWFDLMMPFYGIWIVDGVTSFLCLISLHPSCDSLISDTVAFILNAILGKQCLKINLNISRSIGFWILLGNYTWIKTLLFLCDWMQEKPLS